MLTNKAKDLVKVIEVQLEAFKNTGRILYLHNMRARLYELEEDCYAPIATERQEA